MHTETSSTVPVWTAHPKAEAHLQLTLGDALSRSPRAAQFVEHLHGRCAVRLRDILDHIVFDSDMVDALEKAGWSTTENQVWHHPSGFFPDFLSGDEMTVAFRCESVEQFQAATGVVEVVEGAPCLPFRRTVAFRGSGARFVAVERKGVVGNDIPDVADEKIRAARLHEQVFRARRREFDCPAIGFDHTENLVCTAVDELGANWACALFLRAEREYWMSRCDAGRLQKRRQDAAGIGWSNIDHHTYDASREYFQRNIAILEHLGYQCRELFYAGADAGWGSQILEQQALKSTIFADIDLAPEELDIDFAHMPLASLAKHRRAGLWCAMHGESMLEGGLNHVAGLYDHKALRLQLAKCGVTMMAPFSDLPCLYQELTRGQWRPVDPVRVDRLERDGHLDSGEAEEFRLNGAIATHFENIERSDGYKGFNQPGIDAVLRVIDPRHNLGTAEG